MINHPDVNKPDLDNTSIRAVVTDIEGTTTDISFVHKVLFPYAHDQLPEYVYTHSAQPDVEEQIDAVRNELKEPDASLDKVVETLLYWIETDQKVTPLKALQGMMWADGYQRGAFKGHLYSDVARVFVSGQRTVSSFMSTRPAPCRRKSCCLATAQRAI